MDSSMRHAHILWQVLTQGPDTCSFFPKSVRLSVLERSTEHGLASFEPFCLHSSATCTPGNVTGPEVPKLVQDCSVVDPCR
jgi:hypothetical protein